MAENKPATEMTDDEAVWQAFQNWANEDPDTMKLIGRINAESAAIVEHFAESSEAQLAEIRSRLIYG